MSDLLYAKMNGPPADWYNLIVRKNGVELRDVVEVDVLGCWAMRLVPADQVPPGVRECPTYKDYGRFTIERKPPEQQICTGRSVAANPNLAAPYAADQNYPGDSDPDAYAYPGGGFTI